MSSGPRYFSLGFSCQTRFGLESFSGDHRRGPFDFNISTRAAVIEGLGSAGNNFNHSVDDAIVHELSSTKRQGIYSKGIYFWHDYNHRSRYVSPSWQAELTAVNSKYRFVWDRFVKRLAEPGPKVFVLSNTQENLGHFATKDTFDDLFGLDRAFFTSLTGVFDNMNVEDYRIVFLVRRLEHAIRARQDVDDERLKVHFGGVMNLPFNQRVFISSFLTPEREIARLHGLVGNYTDDFSIDLDRGGVAIARRGSVPVAEVRALPEGYVFVFEGRQKVHAAVLNSGTISFSNGAQWSRIGA